jgi:hypothetical protein
MFMAWKGQSNDPGIYYSTYDGSSWSVQQRVEGVGTSAGPSLTVFNGNMFMAWKGQSNDPGIYYSTYDGSSWSVQQRVEGVGTSAGPSLTETIWPT